MNVLSLFDGISCGKVALDRSNIKYDQYFASEIDKMANKYADIITSIIGIKPILINSNLVSAQNRTRYYWINVPKIQQPENKGIYVKDILENYKQGDVSNKTIQDQLSVMLQTSKYKDSFMWKFDTSGRVLPTRPDGLKIQRIGRIAFGHHKAEALTVTTQPHVFDGTKIRKVTPIEAERLQTLPDNYTEGLSLSQRYKTLGNCWTVDVISHILEHL